MNIPGMYPRKGSIIIGMRDLTELINGDPVRTAIIVTDHCPIGGEYGHPDHQRGLNLAKSGYTVFYSPSVDQDHRKYANKIIERDAA